MMPSKNYGGFFNLQYSSASLVSFIFYLLLAVTGTSRCSSNVTDANNNSQVYHEPQPTTTTMSPFVYQFNETTIATTTTAIPTTSYPIELTGTQGDIIETDPTYSPGRQDEEPDNGQTERPELAGPSTQSMLDISLAPIDTNRSLVVYGNVSLFRQENYINTTSPIDKNMMDSSSSSPARQTTPAPPGAQPTTTNATSSNVTSTTSGTFASDDDLMDVVSSLANTNLQLEDYQKMGLKMDQEDNNGGKLNDLEDSASSIVTASVPAPRPAPSQPINQAAKSSTLVPVSDQLSEPSMTSVHQVWTSSSTSDADELSPEMIGRLQNQVPFLAAYAVRPRIVRASKPLTNGLVAQPSMSNVDYSEIQVESSSSTTSHHHKKETKVKQKKSKNLATKSQKLPVSRRLTRPMAKNEVTLASMRQVADMARRSVERRRALAGKQKKKTQTGTRSGATKKKRRRNKGNKNKRRRKFSGRRKSSASSKRMAQITERLNTNNRAHHMNVIKFGRYYEQASSNGDTNSSMNSQAVGDQTTLVMTPNDPLMATGVKGPTRPAMTINDGSIKGGAPSIGKRPFYRGKQQPPIDNDGADQQQDTRSMIAGNGGDSEASGSQGPPEDDSQETVTVKPKYDGVDDDPEFFDDRDGDNGNHGNNEGRIDDVGVNQPKTNGNEDDGEDNGERIDASDDQDRASRKDGEATSGSRAGGNEDTPRGDHDSPDARVDGTQGAQGDSDGDSADGDGGTALGGGIGATVGGGGSSAPPPDGNGDKIDNNGDNNDSNNNNNNDDNDNGNGNRANTDPGRTNTSVNDDDGPGEERRGDKPTATSGDDNRGGSNSGTDGKDLDNNNDSDKEIGMRTPDDHRTEEGDDGRDQRPGHKQPGLDNTGNGNTVSDGNDDDPQGVGGRDNNNNNTGGSYGQRDDQANRKTHPTSSDKDHGDEHHDNHHDYDEHHDNCSHHGGDHHGHHDHHDTIKWLQEAIPGEPDVDYPILGKVPKTKFNCRDQKYPGYYADVEARCQVFHICQADGRQDSFLCPNGTIFSQISSVCVGWNSFDCEDAPKLYERNSLLYRPMTASGHNQSRGGSDLGPMTMIKDNEKFDDFMEKFMMNAARMPNPSDSKTNPQSGSSVGKQEPDNDDESKENALARPARPTEGFEEDDAIQRKTTDIADSDEIDGQINTPARLRSVPRRKRRASRQPPKLKPKRKSSSRSSRRRKLRHGVKPKGRRV